MIGLAAAILVTSLLGSMHCVGMCGPLALWASGVGGPNASRQSVATRLLAYHSGRLVTFLTAGIIAGAVGGLIATGGEWLGWQQSAARFAGSLMIGLGVWRLLHLWRPISPASPQPTISRDSSADGSQGAGDPSTGSVPQPAVAPRQSIGQRIAVNLSARLARLRPAISRLPVHGRALAIGVVTTLLPCGWLYLFVLVAAATASVPTAMIVMVAFWIGTLPALTALVAGAVGMAGAAPRLQRLMPVLVAMVLLVTGAYTLSGRAAADLTPLGESATRYSAVAADDSDSAIGFLDHWFGRTLPCCDPEQQSP